MDQRTSFENIAILSVCQALAVSCLAVSAVVSPLIGASIAPTPTLATVPMSLQFVGMLITTVPASLFMGRFGRRVGFSVGSVVGLIAGITSGIAVYDSNFYLFCAGSLLLGSYAGFAGYYRLAAADTASEEYKSRAISWVLAGGLASAVIGPEIAKRTQGLVDGSPFAGGYIGVVCLALLSLALLQYLKIAHQRDIEQKSSGRPFGELLLQPGLLIAILCAMVGYGAMILIMIPTPLAMVSVGFPLERAAFVIQGHLIGMFAPSFFTGSLIHRFGVFPIIVIGGLLIVACAGVNLSGIAPMHFWGALLLLGVGWNFMFTGSTTLLTEWYRPEEKAKVQGLNDFLIFVTTSATSLSSGALFIAFGWQVLNLLIILPVVVAVASVLVYGRSRLAVAR